jgi:hypothetical protein
VVATACTTTADMDSGTPRYSEGLARRFLGEDAEGNLHRLWGVRGGHRQDSCQLIGDSQITGPLPATRQSDRPAAVGRGQRRR